MPRQKATPHLYAIEMQLIGVRNFFSEAFQKMVFGSKGLMGFPLNKSQLKAMSAFHEDRQYSMGELCKLAQVKMPSMTDIVDRMVAEGVLERIRDTRDRRVVNVQLTAKGKKVHQKIIRTRERELHNIFSGLEERELETLLKALQTANSILTKARKNKP